VTGVEHKVVVTVAPTGGFLTRAQHPYVPTQPDEIAADVARCSDAGASVAALHARRPDDQATCDVEVYRTINERVRARCDIVINNSTGGGLNGDLARRLSDGTRIVDWEARIAGLDAGADICTLDAVTAFVNGPDGEVLMATPDSSASELARAMARHGIKPEWEAFGPSQLVGEIPRLLAMDVHRPPHLVNLVVGMHRVFQNAVPYTPALLQSMVDLLPEQSVFSISACGDDALRALAHAIVLGGHVRVGIEDQPYLLPGPEVPNARLVEHVVTMIEQLGLAVATPDEARRLLHLDRVVKETPVA